MAEQPNGSEAAQTTERDLVASGVTMSTHYTILMTKDAVDREIRSLTRQSEMLQQQLDAIAAEARGRAAVQAAMTTGSDA